MHNHRLILDSLKKELGYDSTLVLNYLISNSDVEVITEKMVSRILRKIHSIKISDERAKGILLELSQEEAPILNKSLYFLDEEIKYIDYIEMEDSNKSLVSYYYHPTIILKRLRENAN
ncbi:hypothetical protein [Vibrio cyclitrophicus]|uniref:hypothetical protein n=1 Tax=Vibrio cyclitrophicus TaxID=47951 RepID=UPI001645DCDC|nr:hypothetical protein [Vibrio cyclitrophicus]